MKRTTYIFIGLLVSGLMVIVATIIFHIYVGEAVSGRCKFWRR